MREGVLPVLPRRGFRLEFLSMQSSQGLLDPCAVLSPLLAACYDAVTPRLTMKAQEEASPEGAAACPERIVSNRLLAMDFTCCPTDTIIPRIETPPCPLSPHLDAARLQYVLQHPSLFALVLDGGSLEDLTRSSQ